MLHPLIKTYTDITISFFVPRIRISTKSVKEEMYTKHKWIDYFSFAEMGLVLIFNQIWDVKKTC